MDNNKMRGIMGIYLYKFKGCEIYKHLNKLDISKANTVFYYKDIPEFTINNNDNVIETEFYHQFIMENDENEYYLFDYFPCGDMMAEDINSCGIYGYLSEVNLLKLFDMLPYCEYDSFFNSISQPIFLVFDTYYTKSYGDYGYEYESYTKFVGYMDDNLNIVPITK